MAETPIERLERQTAQARATIHDNLNAPHAFISRNDKYMLSVEDFDNPDDIENLLVVFYEWGQEEAEIELKADDILKLHTFLGEHIKRSKLVQS